MTLSRRDLFKLSAFATAAMALPLERVVQASSGSQNPISDKLLPRVYNTSFVAPPILQKAWEDQTTDYYQMTMRQGTANIIPGLPTTIWGYEGIAPGPTIVANRGRQTKIRFTNALPDRHPVLDYEPTTSVHLHGSASEPQYDGYADDRTRPGEYKDYIYPNFQPQRTIWYHDHGIHHTATNVFMGLAGFYILNDPLNPVALPSGRYDVAMVVQDRAFATDGSLLYNDNSQSGAYGNVILVNGAPWPVLKVERRKYRFRILNGSVSRGYTFTLSTGEPVTIVGTDGGLMPKPQVVSSWRHGMAERYEVVIDFSKYKAGQRVELLNLGVPNVPNYKDTGRIMAFDVIGDATDLTNNSIPAQLTQENDVMNLPESKSIRTRQINLERKNGLWVVNGETWDLVQASNYQHSIANPGFGDTEIWEITNKSGGWFHPTHIHLVDFKVLTRNGRPSYAWEQGPKDVVYIGENETVRLLIRFDQGKGRYMMHCHNLPHEDHDMMVQFEVGTGGPDPLAVKARPTSQTTPLWS
jgi:FtsP/CotA-like multicopper oxidase with cupredoxin domain